ncbi:MAG: hypothetical protein LBS96_02005 [Oscillospiraceae bacterium]|jgi:hypothetical protein|nr:hypothetical protein [Oscillospiraceae bacterium]
MANPNNRQEFLRQQARAIDAARDMQRRATLPAPPRQAAPPQRPPQQFPPQQHGRPESHRPDGLHHPCPGQQARYNASYGRTQPPIRRQQYAPPPPKQAPHTNAGQKAQPIGDLFRLFGGLGGNAKPGAAAGASPLGDFFAGKQEGEEAEEGMDSLLIMVLLLLLKQESADQGLLLALMYIMM